MTRLEPRPAVDLGLAREQHALYVVALEACGVEVTELPADEERPDAVFVQDRVLVLEGRAIVCPSAVESRRGEEEALLAALDPSLPVFKLRPPACLDGGDVLVAEDLVVVGLSERSNEAAVAQLRSLLGPARRVEGVRLPADLLHLLSGCSYLGDGRLLAVEAVRGLSFAKGFEIVPLAEAEAAAANALALGEHVVLPAGYPGAAAGIEALGLLVHAVPVSEFEKRDAGVTCLSMLF